MRVSAGRDTDVRGPRASLHTMTEKTRDVVDLDRILIEEVGQFGPYQLRNLMLAAVIGIFTAFAASEYVFTTARVPSR